MNREKFQKVLVDSGVRGTWEKDEACESWRLRFCGRSTAAATNQAWSIPATSTLRSRSNASSESGAEHDHALGHVLAFVGCKAKRHAAGEPGWRGRESGMPSTGTVVIPVPLAAEAA